MVWFKTEKEKNAWNTFYDISHSQGKRTTDILFLWELSMSTSPGSSYIWGCFWERKTWGITSDDCWCLPEWLSPPAGGGSPSLTTESLRALIDWLFDKFSAHLVHSKCKYRIFNISLGTFMLNVNKCTFIMKYWIEWNDIILEVIPCSTMSVLCR